MCMLTFLPGGVAPDVDALSNGALVNEDGHGYAVIANDEIIVGHGMDAGKVIDEFASVRTANPGGPALFHSRFGTHGNLSQANCHPFQVGGDERTVLAHNGVLPRIVQPGKDDHRSDTRIAAEDFLPTRPFGSLGSKNGRRRMERWLTPANKVVILTVDPAYRGKSMVFNEDQGIWHDGIWYSNRDFLATPEQTCRNVAKWWSDDSRYLAPAGYFEPCQTCGSVDTINLVTGYCEVCGGCVDCGDALGYCECYLPAGVHADEADAEYSTTSSFL
jgi:hypothetical protein